MRSSWAWLGWPVRIFGLESRGPGCGRELCFVDAVSAALVSRETRGIGIPGESSGVGAVACLAARHSSGSRRAPSGHPEPASKEAVGPRHPCQAVGPAPSAPGGGPAPASSVCGPAQPSPSGRPAPPSPGCGAAAGCGPVRISGGCRTTPPLPGGKTRATFAWWWACATRRATLFHVKHPPHCFT